MIVTDCGFYPGTEITDEQRIDYLSGIDNAVEGNTEQLAYLISTGWLALSEIFRTRNYERNLYFLTSREVMSVDINKQKPRMGCATATKRPTLPIDFQSKSRTT